MPQVDLHHDDFDVHMEIAGEAPTDVYSLADRLLEMVQELVGKAVKARLAACLCQELGPRGKAGNCFDENCGAGCPRCGSGAAYRKGFRRRTVEVRKLGAVDLERPYLECRECGRSYTPYTAGIPERKRYARGAMRRPMEATLETSYRRGAEAYPESPSARTLWRIVREGPPPSPEGPSENPPENPPEDDKPLEADATASTAASSGTCVADATRIPARKEEAQHSLPIAHAVQADKTGGPGGRPSLNRQFVAARVGSETRLREALSEVPVSTLVTDGQMEVSSVAEKAGRCRWHLPRSVRYLLYNDNVSGEKNQKLTSEVRSLAYADYANPVAAETALTGWAAVRRQLAPQAAGHVERAARQIAVYARPNPPSATDFTVETTAPAEREMRELIPRAVGTKTGGSGLVRGNLRFPAPRTCYSGTRSTDMIPSGGPSGSPIRSQSDYRAVSQC